MHGNLAEQEALCLLKLHQYVRETLPKAAFGQGQCNFPNPSPSFSLKNTFPIRQIGPIQLPDFPLLLAPMEDVSDPLYRAVCKMYGADLILNEKIIRDVVLL
jgi:hypothetical protein